MNRAELDRYLAGPEFSSLDRAFADLTERLAGGDQPALRLAAALVSQARERGDVCLDLGAAAQAPLDPPTEFPCPPLGEWRQALRSASTVVGSPGEVKPLILDAQDRLYLRRYWWYEDQVAQAVLARRSDPAPPPTGVAKASSLLRRLFPDETTGSNWQRVAAWAAWRQKLSVISGGPGTGKTTTVVRIMAWLAELALPQTLRWAIAAPTGKAAARLQESLRAQKANLAADIPAAAALPDEVKTIHRWLGAIPDSPFFRHHAKRQLPIDALVVDEASMIDLALMAKLLAAVPPAARIILLGDKDQLASVEAGNVLGDLCASAEPNHFSADFVKDFASGGGGQLPRRTAPAPAFADGLIELRRNYRFGAASGIHQLSQAVQRGDAELALNLLEGKPLPTDGSIQGRPLPPRAELRAALREVALRYFGEAMRIRDPRAALAQVSRFRLLAAVREGPFGVVALNQAMEEHLREAGLLAPIEPWYAGRQVLVTANDYSLELFNGDLGVALPDAAGALRVWFPGADGAPRSVAPAQLPTHETAFALTVHKSQGSEFDEVLLLLPDRPNRVLSRELIYTGLTRARTRTEVWHEPTVLREAILRRTTRASGLRNRLWGGSQ